MLVQCPHCGFSREVDSDAVPTGAVRVQCPTCRQSFPLAAGDSDTFSFAPAEAEEETTAPPEPPPPVATQADLPKAGFWVRVVASLIDSALLTAAQTLLGFLLGLALAVLVDGYDGESMAMLVLIWLFSSTLGLAYYVLFTAHGGQTPGKMAVRIKVVRTDGSEIALGRAFYREAVCKFLSAIILGIGYLMVAFDEKKQGLHDRMADTYVVKL